MAYVPQHRHDIFFSYAHEDDSDWIKAFCDSLRSELVRAVGPTFSTWQDTANLRFGQRWPDQIEEGITGAALFLAVCSPSYDRSPWCAREWQTFFARNQASPDDPTPLKVGETGAYRFVKTVMRLNQERRRIFPNFQELRLHDDQGFEYAPDSREFRQLVRKAARDLGFVLESMRRSQVGVFLAAPAPDVWEDREALLRELTADFDVRPNFQLSAAYPVEDLRAALQGAQLAVFTLGALHDDYVQKQIDEATQLGIPIAYWLDARKGTPEPDQSRLLAALRDRGCPVLNGLSGIQVAEQVIARLRAQSSPAANKEKSVFLLYDSTTPADGDFANGPLAQMIRDRGLTVFTPDAKLGPADRLQGRDQFLEKFDGVLLYRDQAPEGWLWPNVMELSVAETTKSCVLAPSQADVFSRFVPVIPRGADFGPRHLAPFFEQLAKAEHARP